MNMTEAQRDKPEIPKSCCLEFRSENELLEEKKLATQASERCSETFSAAVLIDDALLAAPSEKLLNREIQLEDFFPRRVEN